MRINDRLLRASQGRVEVFIEIKKQQRLFCNKNDVEYAKGFSYKHPINREGYGELDKILIVESLVKANLTGSLK